MRKLLSIFLLTLLSTSLASPLVALLQGADAGVPICCRSHGEHHCIMGKAARESSRASSTQLQAPASKCPFCPRAVSTSHMDLRALAASASVFAPLLSHPAGVPQTESRWRIARDRSRQKRGPPSFLG